MKTGGYSPDGPPRALADRLAALLKGGCSRKDACMVVGVHHQTLRRWMKKGQYLSGDRNHRYCFEVVTVAEGKVKAKMVQRIINASDWKAAAHWLSKRDPDEWGDKRTVAIEDKRIAGMDKLTLLKELREQQALLEEAIEAEGVAVPDGELAPPEEVFSLAAEAGAFDEEDDDHPEHHEIPLPKEADGTVPVAVKRRSQIIDD